MHTEKVLKSSPYRGFHMYFIWCPSLPHLLHLCDPPTVKTALVETVSLGLRTLAIGQIHNILLQPSHEKGR